MKSEQTQYQLVTIEEMKELAKSEAYKVPEEVYPLELLKDAETGRLYTDFFVDFQEEIIRSHIMVELLSQAFYDVDWTYVTNNYDPHIIARICGLYRYPLRWIPVPEDWKDKFIVSGKICAERYEESREDENIASLVSYLAPEERAISFAENLPSGRVGESTSFMLNQPIHDWPAFLANLSALDNCPPNPNDPYFMDESYPIFERKTFIDNWSIVCKYCGKKKGLEIIRLLRDEWKYITKLHLFGYEEEDDLAKDFEHFLFEELDFYIESWKNETEEKSEIQDSQVPQDYSSCIFTKQAKINKKQAEIIEALKKSMEGAPDKARVLVKEIRYWQEEGDLDRYYNASIFYKEIHKFISLPFSYDGFRKYYNN